MASAVVIKSVTATAVTLNTTSPFQVGNHITLRSIAGATLYGANSPANSNTAKFASFKQSISGNKAFTLPTAVNVPQNTVGGALALSNQLRVVAMFTGLGGPTAAKFRARGDQVAPALGFVVAYGGGTAVADATLSIKGTTAANLLVGSTLMSIASSGVDTNTILVGDQLTVATGAGAADSQIYTATATTISLNGTTEINVAITPPLQVAKTAGQVVTITSGGTTSAKTLVFNEAPGVGQNVDVWVLDAADVITVTGGALTANQPYDDVAYNVFVASANTVDLAPLGVS